MSIPSPRFRIARPGYETAEVDAFLERVADAMDRLDGPTLQEVRLVRFAVTHSRPGYDQEDVEEWLALLAAELDRRTANSPVTRSTATMPIGHGLPPELQERHPSPGPDAVRELPATPGWVRVTAALLVVTMVAFFALSYLF